MSPQLIKGLDFTLECCERGTIPGQLSGPFRFFQDAVARELEPGLEQFQLSDGQELLIGLLSEQQSPAQGGQDTGFCVPNRKRRKLMMKSRTLSLIASGRSVRQTRGSLV